MPEFQRNFRAQARLVRRIERDPYVALRQMARGNAAGGDCHWIAYLLMLEMPNRDGWSWCMGTVTRDWKPAHATGLHSWIEHDGWALDAANGKALWCPVALYYEEMGTRPVVRRCEAAFKAWLGAQLRRELDFTEGVPDM